MGFVTRNALKLSLGIGTSDSAAIAAAPGGATQSGTTVTITTTTPHNLAVGQLVTIAGVAAGGYNGVWSVQSFTATTFTFQAPTGLSASGGGTVTGPADAGLDQLIEQCSTRFESACNRIFAQATYTEILPGTGTEWLPTQQRPVISITNAWEDDDASFGSAAGAFAGDPLVAGVDYALKVDSSDGSSQSGLVQRIQGVWTQPAEYSNGVISAQRNIGTWGNFKITYVAGFSTIPLDVQQAVMTLCGISRALQKFGTSSDQTQFAAPHRPSGGMPPEVSEVIERYKTWAVG